MVGTLRKQSDLSNASGIAMGDTNKEYFWACDLSSSKKSQEWHIPNDELEEDDEDYIEHTLVLRSVCLGAGAVEKEENIVVMESVGEDGQVFKGTIANLTKGVNPMVANLSLTVDGKSGATFTLVEGSGPVSICANRLMEFPEDDDLDGSQTDDSRLDETEEVTEEDETEDSMVVEEKAKAKQAAKRKAPAPAAKATKGKKAKMEEEEEEEDDDEEDDSEEDEEDEESEDEDVKVKKPKKDVGKAAKGKNKPTPAPVKNGKAAKKVKK